MVAGKVVRLGDELPPQPATRAAVMPRTAGRDNTRRENKRLLLDLRGSLSQSGP
jgi:hypothetical protein